MAVGKKEKKKSARKLKKAAKPKKPAKPKKAAKPKMAAKAKMAGKAKKPRRAKTPARPKTPARKKVKAQDAKTGPGTGMPAPARLKTTPTRPRQQPESLRLRSAGPSFTVSDIQKSLAFYRDVLGFNVGERWETDGELRGVEMLAGRVSFWLGQDDWKKGRDRAKGQGFRVYCRTAQDIDALAGRIVASGGTIAEGPRDQPRGGRELAVRDPDGFTITIAREG